LKNKVWYTLVALGLIGMLSFYYIRWKKGGFSEITRTKISNSSYLIHGVRVKGSFSNTEDGKLISKIEQELSQELNQDTLSFFYYVNPTRDNHKSFDLFVGVEVKDSTISLVDTFETKRFDLGMSLKAYQKCDPQFNSVSRDLQEYAEKEGVILKPDSIFEQYSKEHIFMQMLIQ